MAAIAYPVWMLEQEVRALATRLDRVKPFALHESMLPAAALLPEAQTSIEGYLLKGRRDLRAMIQRYLRWLHSPVARRTPPEVAQRRFSLVRLRFNAVLTQFDLFNDVITQRSENEIGVWLSGLDVVSADALKLPGNFYRTPPVICYLDRGVGAAIRRARTRLPGGGANPVAIIRVPRERLIGSGIASSLIHEVGHQAAALLDLVNSLRPLLQGLQRGNSADSQIWGLWERWISEILADFWSVSRIGIASTLGLMGVVSLPKAFVFRISADDPHPPPWVRVKLSCAMGQALYPDPQWARLSALWDAYYPLERLPKTQKMLFQRVLATMPGFVTLLVNHRPKSLEGSSLSDIMQLAEKQPQRLRSLLNAWRRQPADMYGAAPTMTFAVIGQARADGTITPEQESTILGKLLTHWALSSTLAVSAACSRRKPRLLPSMHNPLFN